MRIEFYLSGSEIQLLREAMDSLPLVPYLPVILKVLAALPIGDINTDSVATAPACPTRSAGSGILAVTRVHQAQMQADINRQHLEAETFDKMVSAWLHAPLKGPVQ